MKVIPFIANSAAEAVELVRAQLGPEAVVLSVRPIPASGLARLWQGPRIEVLAYRPDPPPGEDAPLAALRLELAEIKRQLVTPPPPSLVPPIAPASEALAPRYDPAPPPRAGGWQSGAVLEALGLLPLHAQRLVEELRTEHGAAPPATLGEELALIRAALTRRWRPAATAPARAHVFVGPPGVGKTTSLCKWLAQLTLLAEQPARVWRLDGATANTAELLTVYGEILGVPVERLPQPGTDLAADATLFIDLPGVAAHDATALSELRQRLATLPSASVHLVLNAAYETPTLLAQARAFSTLPLADLILTHLDEETRWGKLWNLVLGTNCHPRFLSAGQNIPGDFVAASAELLLAHSFPAASGPPGGSAGHGASWQVSC